MCCSLVSSLGKVYFPKNIFTEIILYVIDDNFMAFYYTFIELHRLMFALKEHPLSEADCRMMLPDEVLKCQSE